MRIATPPWENNKWHFFFIRMGDFEIPTIGGEQDEAKEAEMTEERGLRPVSIRTLFLRFSSKKELMCLLLGFVCTAHSVFWCTGAAVSGVLTPIFYIYSGRLLDELNTEELDYQIVKWILFWYSCILFFSSIFAFFEKYLLHFFAGWLLSHSWCIRACDASLPRRLHESSAGAWCWVHRAIWSRTLGSTLLWAVFCDCKGIGPQSG